MHNSLGEVNPMKHGTSIAIPT